MDSTRLRSYSRAKGIVFVLMAAMFWGVSGTFAQFLFQQGLSLESLVSIRLLGAGIILLGLASFTEKESIWAIWKDKSDILGILLFSVFGMLAVQYTYFAAIHYSNAATATVLQFLAPVLIASFLAIRMKKFPESKELLAVAMALIGTFLLVTKGNINSLSISGFALFWGISSALALAFYTLYPRKLLAKWGSIIVIGWGLVIGGLCFSIIYPPWHLEVQWSLTAFIAITFIVLFGTIFAFYIYFESLKYINPSEASLLVCVEPLSAAFLSVVWLHVQFGLVEWIGAFCIISTVFILSLVKNKRVEEV